MLLTEAIQGDHKEPLPGPVRGIRKPDVRSLAAEWRGGSLQNLLGNSGGGGGRVVAGDPIARGDAGTKACRIIAGRPPDVP